ncbi:LAG1-domain-containing protein [Tothia fuscella]|uniref:LAG1-domain-containing protein n=1 Tax=Tothia fuscella TaxID=1048955 RepID=A0A9P4NKA3_9PEZI|nr:LAG1-domain-containing protein [Tothia fuscella]
MSLDMYSVEDVSPDLHNEDKERPKKVALEEYLVKDSFVPAGGHKGKVRKVVVTTTRHSRRRSMNEKSPFAAACAWVVEHQIGLSINLLLLLLLTHLCFPRARQQTRKFFRLSYYDAREQHYLQGWDDGYFVLLWVVVFTGVRVVVMDYLLTPFACWAGIKSEKMKTRFAEQGWQFLYYVVFWSLGAYIMYHSDYWLDPKEMWTNFPTRSMTGLMKWYYLVQFAFWVQQLFVLHIEEKRKDHWQMFTHHIFTNALMFTSYGFYQTKVGNVILCIMDFVDILLPFAKMLNYLDMRTACDIAFGVFISAWFFTRHICYLIVCWSIHVDVPKAMPYACFDSKTGKQTSFYGGSSIWTNVLQSFNRPDGTVCFNNKIRVSFLSLLLALQVLTVIWFGMIVRVAYRVLSGKGSEDPRSDDECEDEVEDEEIEVEILHSSSYDATNEMNAKAHMPIEEEVDAEALNHKLSGRNGSPSGPLRRTSRRTGGPARATAISIPGHGDHKELLGRIGCDKPS